MSEFRRRLMMAKGSGLPYDSEVEYLKTDGNSYIDTEITGSSDVYFDINVIAQNSNLGFIFGSAVAARNKSMEIFCKQKSGDSDNGIRYQFGNKEALIANHTTIATNTFVNFNNRNGSNKLNYFYEDTSMSLTCTNSTWSSDYTYYIFAVNRSNSAWYAYGEFGVYSLKLWKGGQLVRDMIPVRVGQVGYMYDKVSEKLFENKGTGNFIIGNDITPATYDAELDYLCSDGNQYIRTYIWGDRNIGYLAQYSIDSLEDTSNTILGSRSAPNSDGLQVSTFSNGTVQVAGTLYQSIGTTATDTYYNLELKNNNVYLDSNIVRTVNSDTFVTPTPIYLFALNQNGSVTEKFKGKIKRIVFYDRYTLETIADFIPVRVGQVGYMYDKVKKKLYGNRGTGNFILGNDVN